MLRIFNWRRGKSAERTYTEAELEAAIRLACQCGADFGATHSAQSDAEEKAKLVIVRAILRNKSVLPRMVAWVRAEMDKSSGGDSLVA